MDNKTTTILLGLLVLVALVVTPAVATQCSGVYTTENSYGIISDHTGGGNYTRSSQGCLWHIKSPPNETYNQIAIVFDYFDTAGEGQRSDFLVVADGSSLIPELAWFYGYNQTILPVISSKNQMTVGFYTYAPSSSPTGRGFQFQYSSSHCPAQCNWQNQQGFCFAGTCNCSGGWRGLACDQPYCANDCGGSSRGKCVNGRCQCKPGNYGGDCLSPQCNKLTIFTDNKVDSFSDHIEGLSGKNQYEHATNCSWLIKPDNGERVVLSFSKFDLEDCSYMGMDCDVLYVYDGETSSGSCAKLLGKFTGSTIPETIVSSGNALLLQFITDTGVASSGFTASYTTKSGGSGDTSSPGSSIGYLFVAFLCTILGAAVGAAGYHFYQKWQQKKDEVQYSSVAVNDDDLLGGEEL